MSSNRILWRIICLLCAAALAAGGWALLPERREPQTSAEAEEQKRAEAFRGTITVWHISQWRTGGVNASALLSAVLDQMEGRNPGVYFTLETLDPQQAGQRMAQGESPDILSFPGGIPLPMQEAWQALDCDRLLPCYQAYVGEESSFLPWIASDAKVMVRDTSLAAQKLSAPGDGWTLQEMIDLASALTYQTKGKNSQTVYGIAAALGRWPALEDWGIAADAILPGEYSEREAWDQLVEGNVSMLIAGPWEEMTLAWRQQEDRGPQLTVLEWPQELPRLRSVQWIGAKQSGDSQKDEICRKTITQLLSASSQKKVITQAKCLPCVSFTTDELGDVVAPVEQGSILYALPNREILTQGEWPQEDGWGVDQGVYLWKP